MVSRMLKEVEAERDRVVASEASDRSVESKIQRLVKLRGIGPESATVPAREFFYRHFDNRRQVGAYAGLTPSPYAGGAVCRNQGISKAGNALVRTTMVELAWFRLRHQPDSALSQWFKLRVGSAGGRVKRIAIVALARKLLVALWRYLEQGLVPTGALIGG